MARSFTNSKDSDIVSITTSRDQTTKLTQLSIFNEVRQNLKTLGTANPIKQNNATYNNSFKVCSAKSYGTLLDVNRGYMQRLNVCPNDCIVAGTLSVQSIDNYINATTEDDVVSLSLNVNTPPVSGYVLSSTTGGDLSWIQPSTGSGGNFSTPSDQDLDMNSHDIFNVNNIQSNGITINASPPIPPLLAASVTAKAVTEKVITFVTDTTNTLTYDASGNLNFVAGQADITGVNSVISGSTSNTLSLNSASGGTAITIEGTPNIITLDVTSSSLTYDASGNLNFNDGQADITGVNSVISESISNILSLNSASGGTALTIAGTPNIITLDVSGSTLTYDASGNLNFNDGQADITGVNSVISESTSNTLSLNSASGGTALTIAGTPNIITLDVSGSSLTYDASGNLNFNDGQADINGVNSVISESTSNILSLNAASGGTALTIAGTPNIITLDVSGSTLTYDASGNLNFNDGQADINGVNNLNVNNINVNTITFSINEDGCGDEAGLLTGVSKVTSASITDTLALLSASESSSITVQGVNSGSEESSINFFTNYTNNWLQYDEAGNLNFLQGQADITGVNNINLTTINGTGTTPGQVLTSTTSSGLQFASATETQIYFTLAAPIVLALNIAAVTVTETQGTTPTGTYYIQPGTKNSNFANVRSGLAFRNKTIVLGAVASTNIAITTSTIVCRLYNSTSASSLTNLTPCGTTTLTSLNYTGNSFVCNTNFDGLDSTPQFLHVEVEVLTAGLPTGADVIIGVYVLNYN
jgi:hypothetical protein